MAARIELDICIRTWWDAVCECSVAGAASPDPRCGRTRSNPPGDAITVYRGCLLIIAAPNAQCQGVETAAVRGLSGRCPGEVRRSRLPCVTERGSSKRGASAPSQEGGVGHSIRGT